MSLPPSGPPNLSPSGPPNQSPNRSPNRSPAPAPPRRLDASMTLLREVMDRPLDPSYAAVAAAPRSPSRRAGVLTLLLAILAGAAFAISVGSIRQPLGTSKDVNASLLKEYEAREAQVKKQERSNAALREANSMIQRSALGAAGAALAADTQTLGMSAGEVPLAGPGLRFTVDDAPGQPAAVGADPRAGAGYDSGIVLDADLQVIVNGLWAAGAEAIAINGHRLTALSAIRTAGQAILVDFRPLVPPYVIDAVGNSSTLQSGFASGSAGAYVQSMRDNSGIRVSIAVQRHLALPGAGELVLRQATSVPTATPTAEPTPTPGASRSSKHPPSPGPTGRPR